MPDDLDWEGMDPPGPQTERDLEDEDELGQSEELDGDAGDIADEGTGRRG